jgi:hypothetical protein
LTFELTILINKNSGKLGLLNLTLIFDYLKLFIDLITYQSCCVDVIFI